MCDSQQASQASALMTFYAAQGCVVTATDYLGLGKSDYKFHPYLHADSEASAIIMPCVPMSGPYALSHHAVEQVPARQPNPA